MSTEVTISPQAEEQIEFHKVRELLAGHAKGAQGREQCLTLHPLMSVAEIDQRLAEVQEYVSVSGLSNRPQLSEYEDITEAIEQLRIDGFTLKQEELHEIACQSEQVEQLNQFFSKGDHRRDYPVLAVWPSPFKDVSKIIKAVRKVIAADGSVRPDASPLLTSISKSIDQESSRLNREFVKLVSRYKNDGFLTDTLESVRSGRRVLCVQAEHKRKIRGIIHDESTTGRTVFIEPDVIVEINNAIIELEGEYKKEIYRLLKELCHELRPQADEIEAQFQFITYWDFIQCIAKLGMQYDGQRPKIQEEPTLHLLMARHPLLYLKNKSLAKPIIPFDLVLHPPNRLLVLSGPNAGGKSILMKATGLIQVMAQCGMLIPADGSTVIGIFKHIAVDIGDQQSIEEDLSTYSSRLKNMEATLRAADERTLILIDEFGSGTDPKIGGAIAEAILHAMVKRNAFGVLTTHYPNIKMYAYKTKGVVNGAMLFDKSKIQPTYQLKIGKPGSSFAFEIAERTGLPEEVIAYARKQAGSATVELEDLIHDLDDKTMRLDQALNKADARQKELDRLIVNYEQLRMDLEIKRKKFKLDQKKAEFQETSALNQEMNKALKELRKEKNEAKARKQLEELKERQAQEEARIKAMSTEILDLTDEDIDVAVGDHVKLRATQQAAVVERVMKDKAEVIVGQIRMVLPISELQSAKAPVEVKAHRSVTAHTDDYSKFENELDIRGMLPEEAERYVSRFIDAAFLSHTHEVRIVHGKGTGALRKLVQRIMKEYPFASIEHPDKKAGGDGVTIGVL